MEHFLNRKIHTNNTFTFNEFTAYLNAINIHDCDMHLMAQNSMVELENYMKKLEIVKLEDSQAQLERIEKTYGLKRSNFAALTKSHHHTTTNRVNSKYCGNKMFHNALDSQLPDYKCFYNQQGMALVQKIYASDFDAYNYSRDEI